MIATIVLTLALATTAPTTSTAPAVNAADLYRQAAEAMPRLSEMTPAQERARIFFDTAPIDDEVRKLLAGAARGFELFEQASRARHCDWGFRADEPRDAAKMVSSQSKLTELLVLRIRQRAGAGDAAAALTDCHRLALFGRRIDQPPPSLVRSLQSTVTVNRAIRTAAEVAPEAPADALRRFARSLRELPPPASPGAIVDAEKPAFIWYVRQMLEHPEALEMSRNFGQMLTEMIGEQPTTKPSHLDDLEDLVKHPEKREPALAEVAQVFDQAAAVYALDDTRRGDAWAALRARVEAMHPLAGFALLQARGAERHEYLQRQTLDMFERGVRILEQSDADAAARAKIAEPFEYVARPQGFRIYLPAQNPKEPRHWLTFGPEDPPPPPPAADE